MPDTPDPRWELCRDEFCLIPLNYHRGVGTQFTEHNVEQAEMFEVGSDEHVEAAARASIAGKLYVTVWARQSGKADFHRRVEARIAELQADAAASPSVSTNSLASEQASARKTLEGPDGELVDEFGPYLADARKNPEFETAYTSTCGGSGT